MTPAHAMEKLVSNGLVCADGSRRGQVREDQFIMVTHQRRPVRREILVSPPGIEPGTS